MILELIIDIGVFLVGVMLLLFASWIGECLFDIFGEMKKEVPRPLKFMFGRISSPRFPIWITRIVGIGLVVGAVFGLALTIIH